MLPLLDANLKQILPKLYEQEDFEQRIIYARFYSQSLNCEWFVLEYSSLQKLFFGIIDDGDTRLGYFTQEELELSEAIRDYEFKAEILKGCDYERVTWNRQ